MTRASMERCLTLACAILALVFCYAVTVAPMFARGPAFDANGNAVRAKVER